MKTLFPMMVLLAMALAGCTGNAPKPTAAPITPAVPPAPPAPPAPAPAVDAEPSNPDVLARKEAFISDTAKRYGIPESEIRAVLAQAKYKQSIVNAMAKPAEATKTWAQYRPIFLTDGRIKQGRQQLADNRGDLDPIAARTGVPAEIILSIMGVETGWGGNMGSHNVLDALYTLAFYYPVIDGKVNTARIAFFTDELSQLFALAKEEGFDILTLKGSYAGAMGLGQFMPSSYRKYAVDGDGDGRRDLFNSRKDAYASIANYFVGFGWQPGKPVFMRASMAPGSAAFKPENWEANYTLAELKAKGFTPNRSVPDLPATLLTLQGAQGTEYWIGFKNFWVITRYNRSPMYAMAVWQLAQEIAQRPYDFPPSDAMTPSQ